MIDRDLLRDLTENYLKSLISEASGEIGANFDARAPFGEMGINSFHVLKIIKALESDFGTLPKSLLFENFNIDDLAGYFIEKHEQTLLGKFTAELERADSFAFTSDESRSVEELREKEEEINESVATNYTDASGAAAEPIRILEKEAYNHPVLKEIVQTLFERYKLEGGVSRGTRKIAPNLFIGSDRKSYFNYSRCRDIILVYNYTGPSDHASTLLAEMHRYCAANHFQLNVMSVEEIPPIGGKVFSATPFGVMQRIANLKEFTLEGGAMRHLRHLVGKFKKAGTCRTEEYRSGTDPAVDKEIVRIIDLWCASRTMVNPMIYDFRADILAGTLASGHRLFLTYLDDVLQNVILITAMSSESNGFLMDLEFYPPNMPQGGLEFAIVSMIEILVGEGCDLLSLGGTYGCKLEPSANADPEVEKILDDLREHGIFNGEGNLQFKNKFRPQNRSVFICRPVGECNPGNVTDVIMMIADPVTNQTSDEANHNAPGVNAPAAMPHMVAPTKLSKAAQDGIALPTQITSGQVSIEGNERSLALSRFGFNPLNIPHEQVDFDLKTDSWAQLHTSFIDAQMRHLNAQLPHPVSLQESLKSVFPFEYFVLTASGTEAENVFSRAWPKKGIVLENLLFPSTIFHFIDKGFVNLEIPYPAIFDLDADEAYKGNLALDALQAQLVKNSGAIAFVCIDVGNNAAGGQPVSIAHLREMKTLLRGHSISLVIDGTRVMENAQLLMEREKECAGKTVWEVAREIFSYADVVIGSLTKDFCVNRGGVIATNDAGLYDRLQSVLQDEGAGVDVIDKNTIAHSLRARKRIEANVSNRVEGTRLLWKALRDRGIPVAQPVGGHCVLIDVKRIPELSGFKNPVASFLCWIYLNTGIRAGAHSAGMQKDTSLNGLVRLAIPVGLERGEIKEIAGRLTDLFARKINIPEVVLENNQTPSAGIHANYKLVEYHNVSGRVVGVPDAGAGAKKKAPSAHGENEKSGDSLRKAAVAIEINGKSTSKIEPVAVQRPREAQDIAIVGMAGRYPKAKNPREMWENLSQGRDCIEEIPAARYEKRLQHGSTEKYRGGFIDDVDKFDSLFFNISPREAKMLDPQERLFLEVAWEAIEDAGYYPENLTAEDGSRSIGVYVGAVWAMYQMLGVEEKNAGNKITPNSFLWSIANRVSYWMNLSGPSLTLDTACSSSLTSIYLACEAIRSGACSAAIAGGVNLDLHQAKLEINAAGGALSEDGVCRAFGKGANGYVAGEGIGALFLKPLEQAVRDKDHIYALIKSVVVNHGGRSSGYTVPNPRAQANLIAAALEKAQIDARSIGYVEAHGTGTALGDPLEITGLSDAFKTFRVENQTCAIGSVKSNIGHLEAAAGVVGLSKILLQMKHRRLAPSLHSSELNEFIDFKNSPFYVVQKLEKWQARSVDGVQYPLRAGMSSFGAGGSNAHIILESYEPVEQEAEAAAHSVDLIFPLSAKNETQLHETAVRLVEYLNSNDEKAIDIAFTLQFGRKSFDNRVAIVAATREELLDKLSSFIAGTKVEGCFAGQVKNSEGLTRFLDRREKEEFVRLVLQRRTPHKLAELWSEGLLSDWQGAEAGSAGRRVSLPTYPFADERHWAVEGFSVRSLQQSAASLHPLIDTNESTFERQIFKKTFHDRDFFLYDHHVAGIPTLPGVAYIEFARKAGEIAGGRKVRKIRNIMWISPIALEKSVPKEVYIELKPGDAAVRFEVFSLDEKGGHLLHSQGTFQYESNRESLEDSEYLDLDAVRARCAKVADGEAIYPVFKSFGLTLGPSFQVVQEIYKNESETLGVLKLPEFRQADLGSMVLHPSLLDGSLQSGVGAQLGEKAAEMFVPFSIGEVEILHPLQSNCFSYITQSNDGKRAKNENARFVKSDVTIVDASGRVLVKIKESTGVPLREVHQQQARDEDGFSSLYYSYEWEKAAHAVEGAPRNAPLSILLFDTSKALRDLYRERLRGQGANPGQVILVTPGDGFEELEEQCYVINPKEPQDFTRLFESMLQKEIRVENICFAWPAALEQSRVERDVKESLNRGIYPFLSLCQSLVKLRLENKLQLLYLYCTREESSEDGIQPENEAAGGFVKTLRIEHPKLLCKTLEVRGGSDVQVLDAILDELQARIQDAVVVRYDEQGRSIRKLRSFALPGPGISVPVCLKENGVYLITGGVGGLGLLFAEYLAREYKARVALTGRSKLSVEREAKVEALRATGAEVLYLPADVSDAEEARNLVSQVKSNFGEIHGIIHAAGVLRDSNIRNKTPEEMSAVFAPKIFGTLNLDAATQDDPLDFFVLFSSLAGVNGNIGQCDYAFANHFMDSFAAKRELLRAQGKRFGKTVSINWSLWADGGMKIDEQAESYFKKTLGIKPISTLAGLEAFLQTISLEIPQIAFLEGNAGKVEGAWGLRKIAPIASPVFSASPSDHPREESNSAIAASHGNGASASSAEASGASNARVQRIIAVKLAEALEMEVESVSNDYPFADYGVNSVMGVNLVRVLSEALSVEIDPLKLFEYTTINELAQYICDTWPEQRTGQATSGQAASTQNAARVESRSISELSFEAESETRFVKKQWIPVVEIDHRVRGEESLRPTQFEPIAIIGMSGRFAESESLNELWTYLRDGKNLIRKVTRWNPEDCVAAEARASGYCDEGSFIESIDRFDPAFFAISHQEAVWMEPQQRLFLEESWRALEDAGYASKSVNEKQCGVYVGCASSSYDRLFTEDPPAHAFWGNAVSVIPARIAYYLNLQGPAIAVDTASSSSLVAVHLACQSLWSGETEMALAGGVFLQPTPGFYRVTNGAGLLSPDGKCYSFDARANGFVPGEGVGVLLLKRLKDALRDGDHIHATIAGSGVNQDGSSNGLIAPNARSQERLERTVYERYQIDPETIGIVEANGTGTILGDSIEFQAITRAFRQSTQKRQFCAIGSIATNLGHAATAAGVAGLIKMALAIRHRQIPPTLHFKTRNPAIDFESSPFYVNTELQEWRVEEHSVRRAAVSSFGIGGTNAHIVLEEPPAIDRRDVEFPGYIVVLSARTSEQRIQQARNMLEHVLQNPNICMNDLSYTLFVGRMHLAYRLSCVVRSQEEMIQSLNQWIEIGAASHVWSMEAPKGRMREDASLTKFGNHCIEECRNGSSTPVYLDHLATIADLYSQGHSLDFHKLFTGGSKRIPLPTYPFADERYWVGIPLAVSPDQTQSLEQSLDECGENSNSEAEEETALSTM